MKFCSPRQPAAALVLRSFVAALFVVAPAVSTLPAQAGNVGEPVGGAARPLSANAAHAAAPTITASVASRAIALNGRLDEADWAAAVPATAFRQTDPVDGAPATERTDVRVLYDAEAIYIGARMYDASGKISTRLGRRDSDLSDSDWFIVVFDSYHDHTGGYRFRVNPSGVFGDEANGDRSWNPVWEVSTAVDAEGWTVEMRLPFNQLRFSPAAEQVWGIQFLRQIRSKAEHTVFSHSPKRERGGPSRFGHLLGIKDLKRGKALEILPYVAASAEYKSVPRASGTTFANPFRSGRDYFSDYGADIKYGLTSNFTLNATINPDFGQIESDEAQVNLSANETFFREQRPFFIEGGNIFRFGVGFGGGGPGAGGFGGGGPGGGGFGGGGAGGGMSQIFYSRRVGRAPQGSLPSASRYADIPDATRILGAAKVTGRTANGWSIGVMEAVTQREMVPWVDSTSQGYTTQLEPQSNYLVTRVRKDLREGRSMVGGVFTAVHRDLADSALALRLRSSAYVAGFDFGHLFANNSWDVSGSIVGSRINGTEDVLTAAQRSSARYYNRPDASYLEVDSSATVLTGWNGSLGMGKSAGLHWTGNVRVSATSPGYEINDAGFQNSADRTALNFSLNYDENTPGKRIRRWGAGLRPEYRSNFGGDMLGRVVRGDVDAQLMNYMTARVNFSHELSSLDDRLTRGGPLAATIPSSNVSLDIGGDQRLSLTWSASASERWDESGGWQSSRSGRIGFKLADWWTAEFSPRYSRSFGTAQYMTRIVDATAVNTFGRRYIFGEIRQTTVAMQARFNVTMTPRLGLAIAVEPFIASGRYGSPFELDRPREYEFSKYGSDIGTITRDSVARTYRIDPDGAGPAAAFTITDPSFNTRSVNGTANLRWDWRPGSALFLVWQHRRSFPANYGDFDWHRDTRDLFLRRAENTFLFKFNYWLNP